MQANFLLPELVAGEHELGHPALGAPITAQQLQSQGILLQTLALNTHAFDIPLAGIKAQHGYIHHDEVELFQDTPNLDDILAQYKREHSHEEDEVRFILGGEGVFDMRDDDDRWMRVSVTRGDLIIIPAGVHHRFFLRDGGHIHAIRLFKSQRGWVPFYRDRNPTLESLSRSAQS